MSSANTRTDILVVDDRPDVVCLVQTYLKKMGLQSTGTSNGIEAMVELEASPDRYKLVLLDLQMPKMDGRSFLKKSKELIKDQGISVCVMSALDQGLIVNECLKLGARDYIVKPLDRDIFEEKIHSLMNPGGSESFPHTKIDYYAILNNDPKKKAILEDISESALTLLTNAKFPEEAIIQIRSDNFNKAFDISKAVHIRVNKSEPSGKYVRIKGDLVALNERDLKKIRKITINNEQYKVNSAKAQAHENKDPSN